MWIFDYFTLLVLISSRRSAKRGYNGFEEPLDSCALFVELG
jgi:hypothetical protein